MLRIITGTTLRSWWSQGLCALDVNDPACTLFDISERFLSEGARLFLSRKDLSTCFDNDGEHGVVATNDLVHSFSIATSMHHSKSFASIAFSCVDSDKQNLIRSKRPRQRSSLDNLVIPGRTRIPSHKSEDFDLQLTKNLLKSSMAQLRAPPPYTAEPLPSQHPSTRQSSARQPHRSRNSSSSINTAAAEQSIYRIAPTPSPKKVRRSDLVIPIRRHQQGELVSGHLLHNNPLRPSSKLQRSYDGAHDYQQESRITSTTWSTVSRISNRIFSDSSSSSREFASAKYSCDYNEIATKLGLPELSQPSNGDDLLLHLDKSSNAE